MIEVKVGVTEHCHSVLRGKLFYCLYIEATHF